MRKFFIYLNLIFSVNTFGQEVIKVKGEMTILYENMGSLKEVIPIYRSFDFKIKKGISKSSDDKNTNDVIIYTYYNSRNSLNFNTQTNVKILDSVNVDNIAFLPYFNPQEKRKCINDNCMHLIKTIKFTAYCKKVTIKNDPEYIESNIAPYTYKSYEDIKSEYVDVYFLYHFICWKEM